MRRTIGHRNSGVQVWCKHVPILTHGTKWYEDALLVDGAAKVHPCAYKLGAPEHNQSVVIIKTPKNTHEISALNKPLNSSMRSLKTGPEYSMYFPTTSKSPDRQKRVFLLMLTQSIGNANDFSNKRWRMINLNHWYLPPVYSPPKIVTEGLVCLLDRIHHCSILSQTLTTEYLKLINLMQDLQTLYESTAKSDNLSVDNILKLDFSQPKIHMKPVCYFSGNWHFVRFRQFRFNQRERYDQMGLEEGFREDLRKQIGTRRLIFGPKTNLVFITFEKKIHQCRKYITLSTNRSAVSLQIDTALDTTVITRVSWRRIDSPRIEPTCRVARNASGHPISVLILQFPFD